MGDGSMGDWPWAWRSTAGRRSGPGAFGALPLLAGAFGASEAGAFGALTARHLRPGAFGAVRIDS